MKLFLHNIFQPLTAIIRFFSYAKTVTRDDGRLKPKYVVMGRSDKNGCFIDGHILCIKNIFIFLPLGFRTEDEKTRDSELSINLIFSKFSHNYDLYSLLPSSEV
jgi:hypothetical protein